MKADFPSIEAYVSAAWFLNCEPASIRAVSQVEASDRGGFNDDDSPTILYERHYFHRLTGGRFNGARINNTAAGLLSAPSWGGHGTFSMQAKKLEAAAKLDRDAALKSCSWGLFQIMGANHEAAGYPDIQRFINAMYRSIDDHLRAFVMFIRHDTRLLDALRDKQWETFARIYNGPGYRENEYHTKMARAYKAITQT
jgi:hypothetical protein